MTGPDEPVIDTSVPHSARIWNYWLGGKDNYAVDREAGDQYKATYPQIVEAARAARQFLARAVRYLAGEAGVRQFLDIGTGLPTEGNTHDVAQSVAPDSRIVYVDNDPLVLLHARALLTSNPLGATQYLDTDMHNPDVIVQEASKLLDFTKPVAVMFIAVLGHISNYDEARTIVNHMLAASATGSYLALLDATNTNQAFSEAQEGYDDTGAVPYVLRTPEQVAGYFEGLELVEPGIVPVTRWRPDASTMGSDEVDAVGGIGRKTQ